MSETPFINASEHQGQLTDREIENRPEVVTEDRIDLFVDNVIRPEVFATPEVNHETIQPPTYEAPSHLQVLRQSIESSPELVLAKDILDVGVAMDAIREITLQQNQPVYRSDYALGA